MDLGAKSLPRIMLFSGGLKRAGAERVVCDLAIGMTRKGLDVTVCSVLGGELEEELISAGVDTYRLNRSCDSYRHSVFKSLLATIKTAILLRRKRIQAINIHGLGAERIALMAARIARTALRTFVFHSNYPALQKESRDHRLVDRIQRDLRKVNHCIAISDQVRDLILDTNIIPENKLSVIVNGIDLKKMKANRTRCDMRAELNISQNERVLIQVGRFQKLKNQDLSVRALSLLIKECPYYRLLFVGSGENMESVQHLVNELHLSDYVYFLGVRDDVPDLLAAADIFLLPSDWEGIPISMLEAFANKLPVVASDVPGIRDIVALDPSCAKLVAPKNKKDLAWAIQAALSDTEWMESARETAHALITHHFDASRMVDEYISFHQKSLESGC